MRVAALFAGVGGIEVGLERAGDFTTEFLCERWTPAQAVLRHRFPGVPQAEDVLALDRLPPVDVVTAGFPCTDLSQAGRTAGIDGTQSGLVRKALALVESDPPTWLLLENVRNMLPLHRGRAMAAITDELTRLGFMWAYRVVDSRFTGVPQRRQRVMLLASRTEDPRAVLFADDQGERREATYRDDAFGFYWTEGLRGLGWAQDAVPTLKGGSTIGIPSPPAVWLPDGTPGERFVTPGVRAAERLQGLRTGWTLRGATGSRREGSRWKLVGNAVTVGVANWIGRRIMQPGVWEPGLAEPLPAGAPWPTAAWGEKGRAWKVHVSMFPERHRYQHLRSVLRQDVTPLSHRGADGFLSRLNRSRLRAPEEFRLDLKEHVELTKPG